MIFNKCARLLLLAACLAPFVHGENHIRLDQITGCPLISVGGTSAFQIPVAIPATTGQGPFVLFQCVRLDVAFTVDMTTTPPTLRVTAPSGTVGPTFVDQEVPAGVVNGINAFFVLAGTPIAGSVYMTINGLEQDPLDFTVAGTALTFGGAVPKVGDRLRVRYRK